MGRHVPRASIQGELAVSSAQEMETGLLVQAWHWLAPA